MAGRSFEQHSPPLRGPYGNRLIFVKVFDPGVASIEAPKAPGAGEPGLAGAGPFGEPRLAAELVRAPGDEEVEIHSARRGHLGGTGMTPGKT